MNIHRHVGKWFKSIFILHYIPYKKPFDNEFVQLIKQEC